MENYLDKTPDNVKIIVPKDHEEWIKIKETTIGGSEIAAICGLNPYVSPYSVWAIKTKRKSFPELNLVMKRGKYLEQAFANLWADENNFKIIEDSVPDVLYVDKDYPFLSVTPDFRAININSEIVTAEVKTTFTRKDTPLPAWIMQLNWGCGFTGDKIGHIIWEYGDPRVVYMHQQIEFDHDMFSMIKSYAIDWWNQYVVNDVEPSPTTVNDIMELFPKEIPDKKLIASSEVAQYWYEATELSREISELEKKREELIAKIKIYMEDAAMLTYEHQVLCTWKTSKRGSRTFRFIMP